ncbi:apoptosis-inducing taf9-like domain protein [Zychaea mexicana]|uniref:apoptosis-inducing taf9-like domain protein n=1 Tax=Zychaea mexicana TaxID=64656 RepID=UPI0022FE6598|nr:apoptosis-inducing taf9-like domain protein [Zychaea mexicana]KAI9492647.1 apoptosis-inducing taf9-like domain protein [Zychaea mexicana]
MEDEDQQALKFAIWQTVDQIVQQEAQKIGKTVSSEFVTSLADVVYEQTGTMAKDLEAFARHGKRSTISMEDVKLCARRNDSLYELICQYATEISRRRKQ